MRAFFKSRRQKAGCVTLVMACVFLFWWARSYSVSDVVAVRGFHSYAFIFATHDGSMAWMTRQGKVPQEFYYGIHSAETEMDQVLDHRVFRTWGPGNNLILLIPYWIVVTLLTLLSAWLILWKPRPKGTPDA